ncbi:extracellular solute-binding protein [Candidatus Berkelbacteria bacterium]|nr:extracellular solute-binding protein [Candidatus Berkelbacteria bacterium]
MSITEGKIHAGRWAVRAVAAGILAVMLTACVGGGNENGVGGGAGSDGPVTIKLWRTFDSSEVFQPIIEDFEEDNTNITIEYTELPIEEYELVVSEALAAGEGPDIWSVRNDWLPRHQAKLIPMPEGLLKSSDAETKTDEELLQALFVPTVASDVLFDGRVYGLPYYVDSLVIWRNDAVFQSRIQEFEKADRDKDADFLREKFTTWDELERAVQLLTERSGEAITVAGIAAGTSNNVERAEDAVYAMMLQNGTQMVSPERTSATFHLGVKDQVGQTTFLGTQALERYTAFADPAKPQYAWNATMPPDVQAFIDGKVAMIFGYQYYGLRFKQLAPTLKATAMSLPQVRDSAEPVDYPQYWVETVTKNAKNPELAWRIVKNLVVDRGSSYRTATGRPSPNKVEEPPTVLERTDQGSPFSFQQETAQSWYKGKRPDKTDAIFRDLIQRVGTRSQSSQNAIEEAAQRITELLQAQAQ